MQYRMLISEKDNLIFFYTPKAGCTTAKSIFFDFLGILPPENYLWGIHENKFYSKFRIYELPFNYSKYLTIQFCRNPYERAVSSFLTHIQHKICEKTKKRIKPCQLSQNINFIDFLNIIKSGHLQNTCSHCWDHAQHQFQTKKIKEIVQIENLDTELSRINKLYEFNFKNVSYEKHSWRTKIQNNELPKEFNKPYEEYLCTKSIALINHIYYKDIEFFGYNFR